MTWTIPNLLTLLRIILIPVLVLVFYSPLHWSYQISAAIFGLAALDRLAGWISCQACCSSFPCSALFWTPWPTS